MILVTGGTGIVGRRIVRGLIESNQPVRVYARGHSDWADNPMPQLRKIGVDVISGDVRKTDKLQAAVQGCTAVIHCANIMRQTKEDTFDSVNVEPTLELLAAAEKAGVQRFIYISCLGASQYSSSKYLQSKWHAESAVRASNFYWTIFRPSLVFAKDSQLTRAAEFWGAKTPFVFVVGSGLNEIRPVSADDVAACVVQSVYTRETVHQSFDLVGPTAYSSTDIFLMAARFSSGIEKSAFKIPSALGYAIANLMQMVNPRCPISDDFLRVLTSEYSGDPAIMQSNFQVAMLPLESHYRPLTASKKDDDQDEEDEEYDDEEEYDEDEEDEEEEEEKPDDRSRRRR